MDIYKKRTAGKIAEIKIPEKGPPDFQGVIVEFAQESGVPDLEAKCGDHLVRASEALEPEQLAAIEGSTPEMRDDSSGASPTRCEEGSILEQRKEQPQSQSGCTGDVNRAQGPQSQSRGGNTIRVVISKQQLAQLLAEGSIKKSSTCKALSPPSDGQGNCDMALVIGNAVTVTRSPGCPWSPTLDTIVEAPLHLTRSPVITRNCKEVEHLLPTKM